MSNIPFAARGRLNEENSGFGPRSTSPRYRLTKIDLSLRAQILLVIGCVVGAEVIAWSVYKTRFYRAAIPADIGLTIGFASTSSSASIWDAMLPIRPKACGGAIFELNNATAAALRDRGLVVLKDARQGRGYSDRTDRLYYYYSYEAWQPTPLPPGWTSQGAWYGLSCMDLGYGLARSIVEAAEAPGSFYTTGLSKMLLIVPSLKLAVYTYTS